MTERLYYQNAYATKFMGRVIFCKEANDGCFHIVLDKTLFYPEGGGQPGDNGVLGGVRILDTQEENGQIIHYGDKPLEVGIEVRGEVNWTWRFDLMQNHSGEHILSGIICNKYSCDNVGFHMGKDSVTIDFSVQIPSQDLLWLEEKANEAIWRNTPLSITYPSKNTLEQLEYRSKKELFGEVRIVQAGEYDCCACCGIHVRFAGEIGMIKMIGAQNYKGGTRIELLCGKRALTYLQRVNQAASEVGRKLSVPEDKIDEAVSKIQSERDMLIQEVKKWKWQSFLMKIEQLPENAKDVLILADELSGKDMAKLADLAAEKKNGRAMVLTPSQRGYAFVLVSRKKDAHVIETELKKQFNCKGGGKEEAVQGIIEGDENILIQFFEEKGFIYAK
ncbi:alanyl-tRNA editing protein [Anaerotignum sp.]|uniref:alanyl-tRNA editing protein n=1 Tax=Anaerotignum sp. TaxID=2039241 RepID=UPI00332F97E1